GAAVKLPTRTMHGRVSSRKSSIEALNRNAFGGRVICEDKSLLIEEAPSAYKSSASVLADLEMNGIATRKATLEPLITFKKVREEWRK
ncbi:MAG: RtcB family protein, partial [Pseudomonadota bacterium]